MLERGLRRYAHFRLRQRWFSNRVHIWAAAMVLYKAR